MGRIGQGWVGLDIDNTINERYGGQVRDGDGDVIGVDMGEDMSMDITMRYGCWGGRRGDCVLIVCDKIDETCVWARKENWKYM